MRLLKECTRPLPLLCPATFLESTSIFADKVPKLSAQLLPAPAAMQDSEVAIRWAIDNVYRQGDLFHLLHVIPEPRMVHVWVGMYLPPDEQAELEEVDYTKEFCKHRFVDMLASAKIPFELHVVLGTTDSEAVARVIAHKAEELPADWVVMAQHSKGRLKELWLGSVTKQLVTQAKVPVAVVPHPT
jgi:nucleotide-binding universal stress UspA family protein